MDQYTATQVGSNFVDQYYKVFNWKRDHAHQFYTDESCILVIDGNIKRSASNTEKIHELIMSFEFVELEIDTTNSVESLNGGVLVVVSGSLRSSDFTSSRKFVQTFFLAPQQKGGYFVLNDVFHFTPCIVHESSECDNALKEESVDSVESNEAVLSMERHSCLVEESVLSKPIQDQVLLQASADSPDGSDDLTSGDESDQQLEKTCLDESDELKSPQLEKTCADESDELKSPSKETKSNDCSMIFDSSDFPTLQELYAVARPRDKLNHVVEKKDETVGQIETPTYACLVNGKSQPSVRSNGVVSVPFLKELTPALPKFDLDAKEPRSGNTFSNSVYVKNLSSTVTSLDVLYEFKRFGKIKPDGVFLRNPQGSGSSFAFVEFQDVRGAADAVKASPFHLGGRRVYVEHKRSKSGASSGGRRAEQFGRSLGRNNLRNGTVNKQ